MALTRKASSGRRSGVASSVRCHVGVPSGVAWPGRMGTGAGEDRRSWEWQGLGPENSSPDRDGSGAGRRDAGRGRTRQPARVTTRSWLPMHRSTTRWRCGWVTRSWMGPVMMVSIMSTDDPPPSPRCLKIEDAAAELATSKSQIYALLRSGELQGIQIGGRAQWRIERVKLEDYIEQAYRKTAESLAELPSDLPDAAAD